MNLDHPAPRDPAGQRDLDAELDAPEPSVWREALTFLREESKWWALPILIVLALVGLLMLVGSSAAGGLIYPFF